MGIYSVLSFTVGERTREIAVRMSSGLGRAGAAALIMNVGLRLTVTGLLLGLAAAWAAAWAAKSVLYGVQPGDLATIGAATALVVMMSVAASWIPTRSMADSPLEASNIL